MNNIAAKNLLKKEYFEKKKNTETNNQRKRTKSLSKWL